MVGTPYSDREAEPVTARLGTEMRRLRLAAGLTQQALADRIYYSRSYVALIETGREFPSAKAVDRIGNALGDEGALESLHKIRVQTNESRRARSNSAQYAKVSQPKAQPLDSTESTQALIARAVSNELRLEDHLDLGRRRLLEAAAYSAAALTLPPDPYWDQSRKQERTRAGVAHTLGSKDVESVRDMVALFSLMDQRRGGGHARNAVVQYLTSDVARDLQSNFASERVRSEMFSAASELAYLCGWMAFDDSEHITAQRYFDIAVQLATQAGDPPMAAHVLRALAHQALDLGHRHQALALATASIDGPRYRLAGSRERALLGVVHARTLAATGQKAAAISALSRAEDELSAAAPGDNDPGRVFFFTEASLAHEAACTLRDLDDLTAATSQFRRSIRTRQAATFTRTHAVTLGYLGDLQVREGKMDEACNSWAQALDVMDGVRSGRARQVASNIRTALAVRSRPSAADVTEIDARAATYLAATT